MGAGYHGGFKNTYGAMEHQKQTLNGQESTNGKKGPIFSPTGHITKESVSDRREFFFGKSVAKIEATLRKYGYTTTRRPSIHSSSNARIIITLNHGGDRNITQVQISKGSKRHGNIPYVKINTSNIGKIKIINATEKEYKTDGNERAILLFRRQKKNEKK